MDAASTEPPAIASPKSRRRTKLTKVEQHQEQILKGLAAGKSQRQVAAEIGCSPSLICEWLDTLDQQKQEISRFRTSRVDALTNIQGKALTLQGKIMDSLMRDGLPDALTPHQKTGLLSVLVNVNGNAYDKERLETGQSTQNHSIVAKMLSSAVSDIYKPAKDKASGVPAPQQGAGSSEGEQVAPQAAADSEAGGPGGTGEL